MALGMVTFASAADYSFKTSPDPAYYGSTNYEDLYDAEYHYGSRNQIDYDIPEIQYGLSQKFLESSLNNPYLNGNTQYGLGGTGPFFRRQGFLVLPSLRYWLTSDWFSLTGPRIRYSGIKQIK